MTVTREAFEQHFRSLAATCKPQPATEPFITDAVKQLADRLDELSAWPASVSDIDVVMLAPCLLASDPLGQDGYAGWTVPDPRGPEHPKLSALYKFDDKKYYQDQIAA